MPDSGMRPGSFCSSITMPDSSDQQMTAYQMFFLACLANMLDDLLN